MRIIGEIKHPACKITVFKMGNKLSIKLETDLLEQTFKIRESSTINGFSDIQPIVDDAFVQETITRFGEMAASIDRAILRNQPEEDDDEFDEII